MSKNSYVEAGTSFYGGLKRVTKLVLEKMEYPIFYIHVEPYIVGKLGYISQLFTKFYFNLSCTERVIFFQLIQPII